MSLFYQYCPIIYLKTQRYQVSMLISKKIHQYFLTLLTCSITLCLSQGIRIINQTTMILCKIKYLQLQIR